MCWSRSSSPICIHHQPEAFEERVMISNCLGSLSLAVLSFVLTTGSHAQAMEEANVPFSFQVGSTQLPAGHYLIKEDHLRKSIRIRNLDTGAMATVSVHQSSAIAAKQAL